MTAASILFTCRCFGRLNGAHFGQPHLFHQPVGRNRHCLAGDALIKLCQYDVDFGQRSLPTMQAYAECDFNIKQTAQYLHIHEKSIRYRIAKMSEICGISFDDIRTQFELVLALNLLKFGQPKLE